MTAIEREFDYLIRRAAKRGDTVLQQQLIEDARKKGVALSSDKSQPQSEMLKGFSPA